MAIYNVDKNGNAPSGAKAGDYVVTAGGTYQVLDAAQYQGMSKDQLTAAGVGFNPSSGLYSKKVSNNTTPVGASQTAGIPSGSGTTVAPSVNINNSVDDVVLRDYASANDWLKTANQALSAQLQSNYNANVANAQQAYNDTLSGYKSEAEAAKANYLANMVQNKEDAYYDSISAMNGANNRGMTNSAQGQAMTNSALWKATLNASELRSERDVLLDNIYNDINALTKNHNIQLTELERNKLQDELAGLSENQLSYLAQIMEIDAYNADARNTAMQNNIAMNFEASEAQKQRDFNAEQARLDREWQSGEAALDRASRGSGGSGSGSSGNGNTSDMTLEQLGYLLEYETGGMTEEQQNDLFKIYMGVSAGYYTPDDWMKRYNTYRNANSEMDFRAAENASVSRNSSYSADPTFYLGSIYGGGSKVLDPLGNTYDWSKLYNPVSNSNRALSSDAKKELAYRNAENASYKK